MTIFRIYSDPKTGKKIIICYCGEHIEYSPKLTKCPFCKIDLPTQPKHFGGLIDPFKDAPKIKFSTEEITQWLQKVHEKEKLAWKAEETTNILLAALQEEDLEIRKQAFRLIKRIPRKLQLLARFRWKIMDGLKSPDLIIRLITLEIVQKWPYKQRKDPRIQKRVKALQTDENPDVQRLVEIILKKPSHIGKIKEEIKDIRIWGGLFLSIGAITVFLFIYLNLEGWLRRGRVIELFFSLPALLLVATWFLSCYFWFREEYFSNKEKKGR